MKVFILEDNPDRMKFFRWYFGNKKFEIYHADNVTIAKMLYETSQPFDLFMLDHDLDNEVYVDSNNQNTGYQFAKFLAEKNITVPVIIHSMNKAGADNMKSFFKEVLHIPFPMLADKLIKKEMTIE